MVNKLFVAISALTGTTIGAGFLGIPYVVAKSGFLIGLIWMCLISIMMLLINLMIGEVALSTDTIHQIPGYASRYLGKRAKVFLFTASIIGLYAALIAYLVGEGESLSFLIFNSGNYALFLGLGFWFLVALISLKGIRSFKKIEPLMVIAVFLVILILGIISFHKINVANLSYNSPAFLFFPFGVILFAFLGYSSIPEMRRVLINNEKLMKKAIIIGSLIPLFVYILFTVVVLGIYGPGVEEIATISFGKIVSLLGIFTMFTAFLALSLALQDTYRFDFYLSLRKAWFLTVFVPVALFVPIRIFNLAGFVKILGLGGAISGGLISIAVLLIHEKLKGQKKHRETEFKISLPLILKMLFIFIFFVGIAYQFLELL